MNDDRDGNPAETVDSAADFIVGGIAAAATTALGGFLCGLMIDELGSVGSISLWALGFVAGLASAKVIARKSQVVAVALVLGCIGAYVVSETLWIYWNENVDSFTAALAWFPTFLKLYKVDAFIAGIFTIFGAHSGYRQLA